MNATTLETTIIRTGARVLAHPKDAFIRTGYGAVQYSSRLQAAKRAARLMADGNAIEIIQLGFFFYLKVL